MFKLYPKDSTSANHHELSLFLGTEIIASSGNHESIFLAESNLTEMESIISNEKTRHERIMTPKSNMLINSWYYLGQLFVKLDRIDEANKCIAEIRSIASG